MFLRRSNVQITRSPICKQFGGVWVEVVEWPRLEADVSIRSRALRVDGCPPQSPFAPHSVSDVARCQDHTKLRHGCGALIQSGGTDLENLDSCRWVAPMAPEIQRGPLQRTRPLSVDLSGNPRPRL